jgi:histidinol-phosphatase (PHP family)
MKICVEVNTGGLRAPCREIYPSQVLLKMCFDQAVPITLGSDAHQPKDVAKDFDKALKLIREAGYENITRFTRREPEQVRI